MFKLLILIIVITGLAVSYFVFFRNLEKVAPKVDPEPIVNLPVGDTLGILTKKKDDLIDQSEQTKDDLTETLFVTAQNNLNSLFGKSVRGPEITVNATTSPPANSETITINFTQLNSAPVKIKKGIKYSLVFTNTPANHCIYILGTKYPIGDDKTLVLQINSSGNYPIKSNSCETEEKDVGNLSVE